MDEKRWYRRAAITVSVAGGLLAAFLFCRFFYLFLPFLFGFGVAFFTARAASLFARRTGLPRPLVGVLLSVFTVASLGALVWLLLNRLLKEALSLLDYLLEDSQNPAGHLAAAGAFFSRILERFSLGTLVGDPRAFFIERLRTLLATLTEKLPTAAFHLLRLLPKLLFSLLTALMSALFFSYDYEGIRARWKALLPPRMAQKYEDFRERAGKLLKRFGYAYFTIFLMTFGELFLGFLILRIPYAFLFALLVALLDIFPILGVGTVLLPLSAYRFLTGDAVCGTGLLVLYLLITFVRQLAEPHLVGKSLGVSPLLMLFSFYLGVRLLGVVGILLSPFFALSLRLLSRALAARNETAKKQP